MNNMTTRYRLTTRGSRGGTFYWWIKTTGKRTSLKTTDADEAQQVLWLGYRSAVVIQSRSDQLAALEISLHLLGQGLPTPMPEKKFQKTK